MQARAPDTPFPACLDPIDDCIHRFFKLWTYTSHITTQGPNPREGRSNRVRRGAPPASAASESTDDSSSSSRQQQKREAEQESHHAGRRRHHTIMFLGFGSGSQRSGASSGSGSGGGGGPGGKSGGGGGGGGGSSTTFDGSINAEPPLVPVLSEATQRYCLHGCGEEVRVIFCAIMFGSID